MRRKKSLRSNQIQSEEEFDIWMAICHQFSNWSLEISNLSIGTGEETAQTSDFVNVRSFPSLLRLIQNLKMLDLNGRCPPHWHKLYWHDFFLWKPIHAQESSRCIKHIASSLARKWVSKRESRWNKDKEANRNAEDSKPDFSQHFRYAHSDRSSHSTEKFQDWISEYRI
jgi:hypothetical protein